MVRIGGGVIFWLGLALVIYLIYKSPEMVSNFIGGVVHFFVYVGNQFAIFFESL